MSAAIRKLTGYKALEVQQLAQDVSTHLEALTRFAILKFTRTYAEPMDVATTFRPEAVFAIDIRENASPEQSVPCMAPVNFTTTSTGVRINAIEGPTENTSYRFKLLLIG